MNNLLSIMTISLVTLLFSACSSFQPKKTSADLADNQDFDNVITEKYWKLIEINGQPITQKLNKEPHFILKNEDSLITGTGGCNGFGGSYTLDAEKSRISFSELFSTEMACPNMEVEAAFLDVLNRTDNYSHKGDTLTLNKARMAPLAKFVAVYLN